MQPEFSKDDLQKLVPTLNKAILDLTQINAKKFWVYLLSATIIGWSALFTLTLAESLTIWTKVLLYLTATVALFHASAFTHELAHIKAGEMKLFRFMWNALVGCPLSIPEFIYGPNHLVHHGKKYGTIDDSEYVPFTKTGVAGILAFVGFSSVLVFQGVVRFMVLAPLSFIVPGFRKVVLKNFSFMGMKFQFQRELSTDKRELRLWALADLGACMYLWGFTALMISGVLPWTFAIYWTATIAGFAFLNAIRTIGGTHFYQSRGETTIKWTEQQFDSIDIVGGGILTKLFFPVGTQHHLTHHLFPRIPYHNLAKARKRLEQHFPQNSFYFQNSYQSMWKAWGDVWKAATSPITHDLGTETQSSGSKSPAA